MTDSGIFREKVVKGKSYPEGTIELKNIFSTPVAGRKYFLILAPLLFLLVGAGWYLFRGSGPRESLAGRVPASAIGYVEVDSLSRWLVELGRTPIWNELAPALGPLALDVRRLGKWSWITDWERMGDPALAQLAEAQLALVLTGIEAGDGELRPRLALIIETHRSTGSLVVVERIIRDFAGKLFVDPEQREETYAGLRVVSYHPRRTDSSGEMADRGLFSAQVGSGWVIGNHIEPLRQVLDAQLGRTPVMSGNFHWQLARRQMAGAGKGRESQGLEGIFGFISGEGVTRILRSGSYAMNSGPVSRALLAGAVGDIATELSTQVGDGIAIHEQYGSAGGLTRYSVMLKPDLVERLESAVKASPPRTLSPALAVLRPQLGGEGSVELEALTIYRVEYPFLTLGQVESALSARIGTASSFLLHQFLVGARESFLGIRDETLASAAIGDEIAEASYGSTGEERLWLVTIRDRKSMERLVEGYLNGVESRGGRSEAIHGTEILVSNDPSRGAAAIIGDCLVLGQPDLLRRLIAGQEDPRNGALSGHPLWSAATSAPAASLQIAFERSNGSVLDLFHRLSRRGLLGSVPQVGPLPLSVRTVRLGRAGLEIESRHPLGNFPEIFTLLPGGQDPDQGGK